MNLTKLAVTTLVFLGGMISLQGQIAQTNIFSGIGLSVPDGDPNGIQDVRTVASDIAQITSVKVRLQISGKFNGDLYVYVRHTNGSSSHISVLLNRPGRTTSNIFGYSDSGFDVTLADTAANDIHSYRNETNPPASTPLFGLWQPDARFVDPANVTVDFPRSAFLNVFNGASASGEWTLFLADMDGGGKSSLDGWGLELAGKAASVITWTNPASISYGIALSSTQLNATANVPGTFVYSPPAGTVLTASNNYPLTVTFLPDDTNSYAAASASVTVNVMTIALTVSADNRSRTYGATNPPLTGTLTGVLNSDHITAAFQATATTNSLTGNYHITPILLDPDGRLGNYFVLTTNGLLTVTPAVLGVSADAKSRGYGSTNPVLTASFTGFVNGQSLTNSDVAGTPLLNTAAVTNSPPGTYVITNRLGSLTATNYTFSLTNGTLTVFAGTITVTASNQSRIYGATNPVFTVSYTGFINGDTTAVISGSPVLAVGANTNSPAGSYIITNTLGSLSATNYAFTLTNGTLTVNPAALGISANSTNKVYNGAGFSGGNGVTYNGFVNGQTAAVLGGTLSYGGTSQGATNAGSYPIVPGGLTATNYAISFTNGTLTILPASLTVTAGSTNKIYGQTKIFTGTEFTTAGLTNGDTVTSVMLTSKGATNTAATGSYSINPTNAAGGGLSNYTVSYVPGLMSVVPAVLGVSADTKSRVYGTTNPLFTATFTGFVNGENLTNSDVAGTPLLLTLAGTNSPPGAYTISNRLGSLTATNYSFSLTNGTLTVAAAIITVTANNQSRSYGATNPVFTASYTGFVNGQSLTNSDVAGSPLLGTLAATNSPPGSYAITNTLGTLTATNYTFSLTNGTLTVNPASLVITANNTNKIYDRLAFSGGNGVTYSGFVNGQTTAVLGGALTYGGTSQGATNAGNYAIIPSGLTATNYAISYSNGTLTVNALVVTIMADAKTKVYGRADPILTYQYAPSLLGGDSFSGALARTAGENIGSYAVSQGSLTLNTNYYQLAYVGTNLIITPAALTVTAGSTNKIYGQTKIFSGTEFTASGLTNGDTIISVTLTSSGATNTASVGSFSINPTNAVSSGVSNYTISYVNGIMTVTPAVLGVSADPKSRSYGATNPVFTASYTGFVNGQSLTNSDVAGSPLLGTLAATNSPPGSYAITNTLGTLTATNYTFSLTNGTLTVAAGTITVTANSQSRSYGATNPVFTASYTGFINGDTAAVIGGSPVLSVGANTNSPVGSYTITNSLGGLSATNYVFALINGTLTVTTVAITVSADNQSRIYGVTNPPLTGTLAGVRSGDQLTAFFQTTATINSHVGDYPITPIFLDPNGRLTNYTVLTNNSILTITKAASLPVLTSSANPALPGSTVTFTASLTALAPSSGTPSGTVQFKIDGTDYGALVASTGGSASISTATLPSGEHTISCDYAGDENFLGAMAVLNLPQVINTPPVAASDTISRVSTQGTRVPVGILLANDSDADGNAVVFDSVNTNSTAGGTISQAAGWVYYTPPAGFTNDDSFTYNVRDSHGGVASGVVMVTVLADHGTAARLTILNLGNGRYRIVSAGVPWGNYTIEFTESLQNPIWQIAAAGRADFWGNFVVDDAAPKEAFVIGDATPNGIQTRFYRAIYEGDGDISLPFHFDLISSANPALPDSSITFTVNLSAYAPSIATPSGTVQFKVDGTTYGDPVVLTNGRASLTTATLTLGEHAVSAEYSGDGNYNSATFILDPPQMINSPPLVIQGNPFSGTKVLLSDLLTNNFDTDGDPLTLQSISPTTAEGGTINLAEGWVFYTPPAGFMNADSFTYKLCDSHGWLFTATVDIVPCVGSGEPSANLSLVDLGSGNYRLCFSGIPWRTYNIEYTESMQQPDWQPLATRTADSQGLFEYDVSLPSGAPSRFYRCISQFAGAAASPFRLAVWTNFIGQTNERTMDMWSKRIYPTGWPNTPPVLAWNTNCILYGREGFTGVSQSEEREGSPGQVPMTLLTRRHAYLRGHSTSGNGLSTDYAGSRVWFCTSNNTVVQMTIAAHFVRVGSDGAGNSYDYGIVIFTEDVPETISPVWVLSPANKEIYYSNTPDLPYLSLGTEQFGHCAAGIPPFVYPLFKGGDSGSPDMIPSPDNKLIMFSGRGTSGITPQMQADIDALSVFEGLNTNNYQLQWYDLSSWAP